jgi:mono/diheme cytochrome c family protein
VSQRILDARHAIPAPPLDVPVDWAVAADGKRLAHVDGCFACHGKALTGGTVFAGPFGTRLTAPNLTRIAGHLSDTQLAAAIRYGIKPDGTTMVAMPSGKFLKSSDGDIAAILAYLRTLHEKPDAVANTQWRLGGRTMLAMGFLPLSAAMAKGAERGPLETPAEPVARGAYLTGVHCSGCHGPDLSGDPDKDSPDLRDVIGHYSPEAFAHFFATGVAPHGRKTQTMTHVIKSRLHDLTKDDVSAIYAYLTRSKRKK